MAPERRAGRTRGKSDPIDALAIARAALREPGLDPAAAGEERLRELKLLVDHRDDLVDERRRMQQRLRWHLHELDPTFEVPLRVSSTGASARAASAAGSPGGSRRCRSGSLASSSAAAARSPARSLELDHELEQRTAATAPALLELPGCGAFTRREAAGRDRPDRPLQDRRAARPSQRRRATRSKLRHTQRHRLDRGGNRQLNAALYRIAITQARYHPPHAPTSNANKPKARAAAKPSAASNANSPAPSHHTLKRAPP